MLGFLAVLRTIGVVVIKRQTRGNWVLRFVVIDLFLMIPLFHGWAQQNPSNSALNALPSSIIDLSATGYREPSRRERVLEDVSESLDYVDDNHVLLTFDRRGLFQRHLECSSEHDDRLMKAIVLEVPSGKVVSEATWYLHDRRPYVWSLGSGEFLLRRLNTLYLVDSSLNEHQLLVAPRDLLWVSVTPDRKQIIIETREPSPPTASLRTGKSNDSFVVEFLDRATLTPQRVVKLTTLVRLEGTSVGYADSIHKGDLWLVRFGSSPKERRNIARVRAKDMPRIFYSSNNSLLVSRCSAEGDYSISSFSTSGHRLWRQHWPQYRFLPVVAHSREGGRFAISTVRAKPEMLGKSPVNEDDEDADAGLQQNIEVIESATGTIIRSLWVSPVVTSEENFSLSPSGHHLAVLSPGAIEIYDLADISLEEQARFAALKADVPDLSAPVSGNEEDEGPLATVEAPEQAVPPTPVAEASVPPDTVPPSESADTATPAATFRAATRAVVVDVVVTDSKGHPVQGLRKEDFEVSEDGKVETIRSFREARESQAVPVQDSPASPETQTPNKRSPNVFSNAASSSQPASMMMILLDLLNTPITDQQFARKELVKFLNARTSKTQFALSVLTGDPNSPLKLIQGFTPDEDLLLAALDKGKRATRWQVAARNTQDSVRNVRELRQGDTQYRAWRGLLRGLEMSQEVQRSLDLEARVRTTTGAMIQLATYLAGIPGRKGLVWLSGSFPMPLSANSQALGGTSHNNLRTAERLSNLLARSQVAVYPVDIHGLEGDTLSSSSVTAFTTAVPKPSSATASPFSDNNVISSYQQQTLQDSSGRLNQHTTLERIASATGGKAFYSANAIKDAISTATEQGSNYYSASYSPSNKNYDGRFRKIKITLPNKQLHLSYRSGYYGDDSAPPKDVARNIRVVAMQHGSPQSRQIHFSLRVAPVGRKTKISGEDAGEIRQPSAKPQSPTFIEVQRHSIDYAINGLDLHFISHSDGTYETSLDFIVASFDSDGRPLTGIADATTKNLQPVGYREVSVGGFRVHQEVDVPVTAASLRIGVQDRFTGYIGTIDVPLPVPTPLNVPRIVKHQLPEIEPD